LKTTTKLEEREREREYFNTVSHRERERESGVQGRKQQEWPRLFLSFFLSINHHRLAEIAKEHHLF
jgi:hypothetical protein